MNENKSSEPKETKATKWQISRHLQSKTLKNVVLFHKKTRQLTNNQHMLARSVHRQVAGGEGSGAELHPLSRGFQKIHLGQGEGGGGGA
jgi:hypothetical protein